MHPLDHLAQATIITTIPLSASAQVISTGLLRQNSAIYVRGQRIRAVGSSEEVSQQAPPGIAIQDLGGAKRPPGIQFRKIFNYQPI